MIHQIGDWYLALDGRSPSAGRFKIPWQRIFEAHGIALFVQRPSESWVGWRWQSHEDERGAWWLQGGETSNPELTDRVAWDGLNPAHLGGSFALIQLDREGRLTVTTDRMGTVHVYGSRTGIGSAMAPVAEGSRRELDWSALTGFFACGFFPSDRTFYEDVRIFQPARRFRRHAEQAEWRGERYWQWPSRPGTGRSYDEALEELAELCRGLMDDLGGRGERLAVPLSGGLDSRLTLAALTEPGPEHWLFSYGYGPRSVEVKIAEGLAKRRARPLATFQVDSYLPQRADQVMAAVEGFQDITQTRQAYVSSHLQHHCDAVVAAHWGDVWMDDMGLAQEPGPITEEQVTAHTLKRLRKRGHRWLLDHLCGPRLSQDADALLKDWAGTELRAYAHIEDPDFRVKAFKTDQWSFRWTLASLRAYQLGAAPRPLFYDPRVVDFFVDIPTSYVAGRRIEIDAIKRLAPDLARVPWQVYDASLYTFQYFNSWLLPKRAMKKAWRLMTRQTVIERNWEVQFLNPEGRAFVEGGLTDRGLRLHDFVSPKAIGSLLDSFWRERHPADGYTVSMLLTFSLWLEQQ